MCGESERDKRENILIQIHTTLIVTPTINIISISNKLGPHWVLSLAFLAASHCLLICHVIISFFIHLTCINWTCLTHNITLPFKSNLVLKIEVRVTLQHIFFVFPSCFMTWHITPFHLQLFHHLGTFKNASSTQHNCRLNDGTFFHCS